MKSADWVQVFVAFVGLLGLLIGLGRFMWNKIERRFRELEAKIEECEQERKKTERRRGILWTIVMLLKHEVKQVLPDSAILVEADGLIAEYHNTEEADSSSLERALERLGRRLDAKD